MSGHADKHPTSSAQGADTEHAGWVAATNAGPAFKTSLSVRHHHQIADEPVSAGGGDEGLAPYDHLLSAVAICTAMTIRVYANRKGWPVGNIVVRARHVPAHKGEHGHADAGADARYTIEKQIEIEGAVTDEQRSRMLEIAERCPVTLTLKAGVRFV